MALARTFLFFSVAWLFFNPQAFAFEMSGGAYNLSGDVNSGAGVASSGNFKLTDIAIGTISGFSAGGIYNVSLGSFPALDLVFILSSPAFNPAELLVTFWRK